MAPYCKMKDKLTRGAIARYNEEVYTFMRVQLSSHV